MILISLVLYFILSFVPSVVYVGACDGQPNTWPLWTEDPVFVRFCLCFFRVLCLFFRVLCLFFRVLSLFFRVLSLFFHVLCLFFRVLCLFCVCFEFVLCYKFV